MNQNTIANILPVEILVYISKFLADPEDLVKFGSSCKKLHSCVRHDDILWKVLMGRHFEKLPDKKRSENNTLKNIAKKPGSKKFIEVSYEDKFIKFIKTLCINCNKKTSRYNEIIKRMVCQNCERNCPQFSLISATMATKEHFLTKEQLGVLRFIPKRNYYNGKFNVKMYMLKDVLQLRDTVFSQQHLCFLKETALRKKISKNIQIFHRFSMVNSIIHYRYSVSNVSLINDILPNIESYSFGGYSRYLRTGRSFDIVVKMCLELDFIGKVAPGRFIYNNYFESFLLENLLFFPFKIPFILNDYLVRKIKECMDTNVEIFKRRNKILDYFRLKPGSENIRIHEIVGSCDIIKRWVYHGNRYFVMYDLANTSGSSRVSRGSIMTEYIFGEEYREELAIAKLYKIYLLENYIKQRYFAEFFNTVAGNLNGRRNGILGGIISETNSDICISIFIKNSREILSENPRLYYMISCILDIY